jgi:hypothetical protein
MSTRPSETVAFFDSHNELLGSTAVIRDGGLGFVGFENTAGLIGSALIQDTDLNHQPSWLITLRCKVLFPVPSSVLACPAWSWGAVAFSAGGEGGRKSPEHQTQSVPVICGKPTIAEAIAIYEYTP